MSKLLKKKKPIIFMVVFLIAMVAVVIFVVNNQKNDAPNVAQSSVTPEQQLSKQLEKACEVFTLENAKTILGPNAVVSDKAEASAESFSDDIAASRCEYFDQDYPETTPPESQKLASIIARTPRNEKGKSANEAVFAEGSLPAGAVVVNGYGDKAFWNDEYGQLNILKAGEWYILEYGSLLPASRNLGDTQKLADILQGNL